MVTENLNSFITRNMPEKDYDNRSTDHGDIIHISWDILVEDTTVVYRHYFYAVDRHYRSESWRLEETDPHIEEKVVKLPEKVVQVPTQWWNPTGEKQYMFVSEVEEALEQFVKSCEEALASTN